MRTPEAPNAERRVAERLARVRSDAGETGVTLVDGLAVGGQCERAGEEAAQASPISSRVAANRLEVERHGFDFAVCEGLRTIEGQIGE